MRKSERRRADGMSVICTLAEVTGMVCREMEEGKPATRWGVTGKRKIDGTDWSNKPKESNRANGRLLYLFAGRDRLCTTRKEGRRGLFVSCKCA